MNSAETAPRTPRDPLMVIASFEGVPSAVSAARDSADAVLRDRGLRSITAETTARALNAGALASAAMEDAADGVERWQAGSVRLSTRMLELAELVRVSPGQCLARAHSLLASGVVADDEVGRVRPGEEIHLRMQGLLELLSRPTEAPALVVGAIAHAELATLRPYGAGDGILGRLVEHLVLVQAGVDPRAALVPEVGHRASGAEYERVLAGYRQGTEPGVREWVRHCATALAYGAEHSPVVTG